MQGADVFFGYENRYVDDPAVTRIEYLDTFCNK
jgi:hypothetical protein